MSARFALQVGPPDVPISCVQMEGGTRPAKQGNPFSISLGNVAKGLSHHTILFEVMVLANQFVPSGLLVRIDEFDRDRIGRDVTKGSGDRMLVITWGNARFWTGHDPKLDEASPSVQPKVTSTASSARYANYRRSRGCGALRDTEQLNISALIAVEITSVLQTSR